ncbi:hypothetical protein B5G43_15825 [Flavonifractor sp. An92]|uniref:hypothetical protein n=1 Tax=Flavonifractor sp. An92 TaxID=1965666 RepID=UPI000B3AF4B2|nr:hypothetical protein [Flavonifractor sp. An92]OUN02732.1 hypothetical protein B5G43_15825 [Flavonifractor sp. An92]
MKMKKIVASASALALTAAVAVGGTLAYLQMATDPIVNTFTAGNNIAITLDEAKISGDGRTEEGQQYTAYVGAVIDKDPTITVDAGSGNCYVFAKVENGFEAGVATTNMNSDNWKLVTGETNVYYYVDDEAQSIMSENDRAVVFTQVTISNSVTDVSKINGKNITVTGYAVQADGFDSAQDAWDATFGA